MFLHRSLDWILFFRSLIKLACELAGCLCIAKPAIASPYVQDFDGLLFRLRNDSATSMAELTLLVYKRHHGPCDDIS